MNEKKINMISGIIKYSLIAIGVVLCLLVINGPNTTADEATISQFRDSAKLSLAISYTGFLIFVCTGLVLLFYIALLISDFKKAIKSIIGIIIFTLVYVVLNMIGTSDTSETLQLKNAVSDATVDSTHAGLITSLIGLAVALLVVVLGPFLGRYRK